MKPSLVRMLLVGSIAATGLGPVAAAADAHRAVRSDAVSVWNANAGDAAVAACLAPSNNPLHESRLYAAMHLAVHDALNAIDRRSRPYAFATRHRLPRASVDAAVATAARGVLVPLLQQLPAPFSDCAAAGVASVETDYAAALATITDGPAKDEGVQLGQAAAATILAMRTGDGADTPLFDTAYQQGTAPGEYRFTPGFSFAFAPGWADVTPFALKDSAQFRAPPPYAVTARRYTADFDEVKRLGGDGVTTPSDRSAEQTEIARFWLESPPLQWNRIARTVSAERDLDPWEQAQLFGLLNMALADGYIGSFETKYHYNYWRPVTAIRTADTDGNPNTSADPTWTPLAPTPPIPDHDSAHSVEGGAAAAVLARFFGTDHVGFATCSWTLPSGSTCTDAVPTLRRYRSFSQAAEENALSRILVGFHFRNAVEKGIKHGRKIGSYAVSRYLRPVR
jgi:PAP2 superfamily